MVVKKRINVSVFTASIRLTLINDF